MDRRARSSNPLPELAAPAIFGSLPVAQELLREPPFTVHCSHPPIFRDERIPHLGHSRYSGPAGPLRLDRHHDDRAARAALPYLSASPVSPRPLPIIRYALGSQAAQYFITFAGCLIVFPIIWRKPFFDGIHWNGETAFRRRGRLISAAVVCFFVAMINGVLMPGPANAPIDELFKAPGAAWIFFAFGVTLAPFFEEMAFRGFLLPALCTAYDWMRGTLHRRRPASA